MYAEVKNKDYNTYDWEKMYLACGLWNKWQMSTNVELRV